MTSILVEQAGSNIASPVVDRESGNIFYVGQGSGEVCVVTEAEDGGGPEATVWGQSRGMPSGVAVDPSGDIYVADLAHCAIVNVSPEQDGEARVVVRVYEERPFKGPNSLVFDAEGTMYFTDSGPMGETGLANPTGSVFCITQGPGGQMLKPLALNCLAHPAGIALNGADGGRSLFVCETMANRLLRFFQQPTGVFHFSVFKQFAGGVGPSCVAVDSRGVIFVGHYDVGSAAGSGGRITVLSPEGNIDVELQVPGPQITGICLSADEQELFVTESTTDAIFRVAVP